MLKIGERKCMPSKNFRYEDFGHLKYVEFEIGTGLSLYELLQVNFRRSSDNTFVDQNLFIKIYELYIF